MANIDQYEKLRLIGNGAFASIWKVRHRELGYIRAIKESKELVTDEHDKAYQTFLKECAVLLRLGNGGHPNIVRIYEPRLIDNRATVEMDFIQGETLNDYLARVRFMPIDEVMRFVREIVGALAYCHVDIYKYLMSPETDELEPDPADATRYLITPFKERELVKKYGVTHNDLHSNNIMRRDVDGSFVLLDFGLSVQDGQAVKSSARNDGALEYLAPEKWEPGKYAQGIGPWTDVYSLGILLYEVLAARVPFPLDPQAMAGEQARHELYTHHMQDTPPPIEPLRKAAFEATHPDEAWTKDYPRWLENIILRCLAKDPDDRYANAREVLDDINAHAERSHDLPTALLDDKIDDLRHEKRQLEQQLDEARADVQHYSERLATLNDERERLAEPPEKSDHRVRNVFLKLILLVVASIIIVRAINQCNKTTEHNDDYLNNDAAVSEVQQDIENEIANDLMYLKHNDNWKRSQLQSNKYKALFDCFATGDIDGIINSDYPSQSPHNGWYDRIINSLREYDNTEKEEAQRVMRDMAYDGEFDISEMSRNINNIRPGSSNINREGTPRRGNNINWPESSENNHNM